MMDVIYDFKLIDMNTNEVVMEGETAQACVSNVSENKPIRKLIVNDEITEKIKIGDIVKIEALDNLIVDGNVVDIDKNTILVK